MADKLKQSQTVPSEELHVHEEAISSLQKELGGKVDLISVIRLVDNLIAAAFELRASDVHVDPEEQQIRVRFRIDGVLHDNYIFPKSLHSELITRIKILCGLRTDEHQAAQDGRFKTHIAGHAGLDVRVSIAPTYFGENCVMRLLAEQSSSLSLESVGYSKANLTKLDRAMARPYGMILATGPTGSGKTTTLYAIVKKLNVPEVSIITIEDPIEYSIHGIDQIQVNARTGLTFAQGLRFILRQDPNIIMVGEIRDSETASIAVNAAMTGHIVLTTLHTNDAATTLPRLLDLGIEPFLIASTISAIIGQRLVRLLCTECKVAKQLSDPELEALKNVLSEELLGDRRDFYTGVGCKKCDMSGFRGRIGIHEILEMNDEIREMIMKRSDSTEIKIAAVRAGMVPMLQDGFEKAVQGLTTIEEVLRVFHE